MAPSLSGEDYLAEVPIDLPKQRARNPGAGIHPISLRTFAIFCHVRAARHQDHNERRGVNPLDAARR